MIFVTVGTHEQPFDRLIKEIDRLKGEGIIREEVVIQTGYSTYEPKYCTWFKLLPYEQMQHYVKNADIVITHGGPSSFMMPLQMGKIPIVVPRQKKYGEHVNDHQIEFVNAVSKRYDSIFVVEDIEKLESVINKYNFPKISTYKKQERNNVKFNLELEKIVEEMINVY